eukprot:7061921-Prymnesium_polylepis.2
MPRVGCYEPVEAAASQKRTRAVTQVVRANWLRVCRRHRGDSLHGPAPYVSHVALHSMPPVVVLASYPGGGAYPGTWVPIAVRDCPEIQLQ